MKTKISWISFIIALLSIVPIRIFSSINNTGWDRNPIFAILTTILMLFCGVPLYFCKDLFNLPKIHRNIPLAITSVIISLSFLWCSAAYLTDIEFYQNQQHPLLMSLLCLATAVTFVFIAITYFRGKNMFRKPQMLIFMPILWCGMEMILFLSISNTNVDPYNVLLKSLLLLFLLYQSQIFVTSTDRNTTRRVFMLGMPAILAVIMYNVPLIVSLFQASGDFSSVKAAICIAELFISAYIVLLLLDCQNQIEEK